MHLSYLTENEQSMGLLRAANSKALVRHRTDYGPEQVEQGHSSDTLPHFFLLPWMNEDESLIDRVKVVVRLTICLFEGKGRNAVGFGFFFCGDRGWNFDVVLFLKHRRKGGVAFLGVRCVGVHVVELRREGYVYIVFLSCTTAWRTFPPQDVVLRCFDLFAG